MVAIPRVVITPGDPAGIGPDIVIQLASRNAPAELVAVGNPNLLQARARQLCVPLKLNLCELTDPPKPHKPYHLNVVPVSLDAPVTVGQPDPKHAAYMLACVKKAATICMQGHAAAMITGPLNKGVISAAGQHFSGQTEFLSDLCKAPHVVMLLATHDLKLALLTRHIPLSQVPGAITATSLEKTLRVLHHDFKKWLKAEDPIIMVLGLNPHAGENGYLGREEVDIISPTLENLRKNGMRLIGPVGADSAFTPENVKRADVFLAMFHDQGLPVLKAVGFGHTVNITLGLPFIRTSVDHGPAYDLAGTGNSSPTSLRTAVEMAVQMAMRV